MNKRKRRRRRRRSDREEQGVETEQKEESEKLLCWSKRRDSWEEDRGTERNDRRR